MWTVHIACLVVFALLTIGLWSRAMSILAFLATVAYANRASLAQFGLDDTNAMMALYLMIGPCGAAYSVDNWRKRRRASGKLPVEPRIGANFAIRLLQVHLCVIYFFSGIGKAQGPLWWNGDAILMATANLEYQSLSADVADSLSCIGLAAYAHHRVLGTFLLRLGVAATDPADRDRHRLRHSPWHWTVSGHVDVWPGDVLCQHGVHFAVGCAADCRSHHRLPILAHKLRVMCNLQMAIDLAHLLSAKPFKATAQARAFSTAYARHLCAAGQGGYNGCFPPRFSPSRLCTT